MSTQLHSQLQSQLQFQQRYQPAQLDMFPGTLGSGLDPQLLALASGSGAPPPIDPALFAIEQVVNDVNRGRIGAGDLVGERIEPESHTEAEPEQTEQPDMPLSPPHIEPEEVPVHVELQDTEPSHLEHDGIDPALREIVDSLTNAQQSHHPSLPGDAEERERIDHETIRTTLEDYAAQNGFGSYGAIFGGAFPQSPHNQNLILPPLTEPAPNPIPEPHEPVTVTKRGRGRPKGSKNKPKPAPPTPEPEPEPEVEEEPRRRKGRPPKIRSAEEIAEMERRKEEKALGITRKRGRPRKYPELGLVREMRLKKNRAAVQEKMRLLEERARAKDGAAADNGTAQDVALGEQVAAAVVQQQQQQPEQSQVEPEPHPTDYSWPYQDNQTLLDVVRGVGIGMGDQRDDGMGQGDDMRGVFSLGDVQQ